MLHASRLIFVVTAGLGASLWPAWAFGTEQWTDASGKFQVEAEFVGVQGDRVMLRKSDGTTVAVPIKRLSAESRAQAKRLYDSRRARASAAPDATSPRSAAPSPEASDAPRALTASMPSEPLNFVPPVPPSIPPRQAFPEDASLQETVDFIRSQFVGGHPEVLWHALPDEMREAFDEPNLRSQWGAAMQDQLDTLEPLDGVFLDAVEVLVNKKTFVLNSPLMAEVPAALMPTVEQGYDPAVGLLYEVLMLQSALKQIAEKSLADIFDEHGPRVGAHLQDLVQFVPPAMLEQVLTVEVEQTSDSTGTIQFPNHESDEPLEMVRYEGRWLPKDLADRWVESKDTFATEFLEMQKAQSAEAEKQRQQTSMAIGFVVGMAEGALERFLAANTQEEFDQAVTEVQLVLGALNPGNAGGEGLDAGALPGDARVEIPSAP